MGLSGIEFRRGSAGGGNQLRQPYLKKFVKPNEWSNFPNTEHVHFFGFYLGNYPALNHNQILELCSIINDI
jgi:CDP-6-deoxy-D-xylo-4-hexulose-3-dehydrase